ncbi:hypothetical protein AHMF7605_08475 [Adhaeribacter arboris]|uniref:DUF4890 domain-containing protein n=1 Tax=Adhaeribacter arboris TaxID=2072846 RepID=A0A2T2YDM0_9BACT|nr:DUF4890 domain-containing protein [Adhaeribacter arboris]PSR53558.1 hypothetical protein AHMF7605_08475 [Adhaeribacter arboris]
MKKLVFVFALGLFAVSATYAQTGNQTNTEQQSLRRERATPEERAARQTKMMAKSLGLTADQETQLQALNLKRMQEMQALRGKYKDSGATQNNNIGKESKTLRENWETQLKAILTPEQFTKYQAQQGEMRDRRHRNTPDTK